MKRILPLKLLVIAEFSPRDEVAGPSLSREVRIPVDKDTFSDVMEKLAGNISLKVRNRLHSKPDELTITIPLDSIKSFHPDSMVEAVPELRELTLIRQLVRRLRDGELTYNEFRSGLGGLKKGAEILSKVEAAVNERKTMPTSKGQDYITPVLEKVSKSGVGKEESLDSLFDMVDMPATSPMTSGFSMETTSILDNFLSLITGGNTTGTPIDTLSAGKIISDLDNQLSAQVNEVLHHPEFRRLEAAWRGLKFLVDRTDFREPIQIEVLNIPKETLLAAFNNRVFEPEYEKVSEVPASVIMAVYEFNRSLQDIELLKELALKSEQIQIPLISSAGPGFLGLDSVSEFDSLPYPGTLFQQPEYIKWDSFRKGSSSRWVSLMFNRFLLRDVYGPDHTRVKVFELEESVIGWHDKDYLWGNPVWAMGSLLSASFARTGWCNDITGLRGGGGVENLPVYEVRNRSGQQAQIPLEVFISEQMCLDLSDNGIIVLTCRLNSDATVILNAPSAHRPERYPDPKETTVSALMSALPYQIFAGRLSQYVNRIASEIGGSQSPDVIESTFKKAITNFLAVSGRISHAHDAVVIIVKDSEERPGSYDISMTILPDRAGLFGLAPATLSFRIHR
jgi:type VI secretion system protein ImpC